MHTTTSATTCAKCKHKLAPQRLLLRRRGPTTLHDDLRLATWPDESELLAPRHAAAAAASSTDFSYAGQDERPRCRVDVSLPPNLSLPIDPSACRPSASLSLPSSLPLALSSLSLRSLFALTSTATTLSLSLSFRRSGRKEEESISPWNSRGHFHVHRPPVVAPLRCLFSFPDTKLTGRAASPSHPPTHCSATTASHTLCRRGMATRDGGDDGDDGDDDGDARC